MIPNLSTSAEGAGHLEERDDTFSSLLASVIGGVRPVIEGEMTERKVRSAEVIGIGGLETTERKARNAEVTGIGGLAYGGAAVLWHRGRLQVDVSELARCLGEPAGAITAESAASSVATLAMDPVGSFSVDVCQTAPAAIGPDGAKDLGHYTTTSAPEMPVHSLEAMPRLPELQVPQEKPLATPQPDARDGELDQPTRTGTGRLTPRTDLRTPAKEMKQAQIPSSGERLQSELTRGLWAPDPTVANQDEDLSSEACAHAEKEPCLPRTENTLSAYSHDLSTSGREPLSEHKAVTRVVQVSPSRKIDGLPGQAREADFVVSLGMAQRVAPTVSGVASVEPNAPLEQAPRQRAVVNQVIEAFRSLKHLSAAEMRIRLEPKELGEVWLKVTSRPEGVSASFRVATTEAKQAIQGGLIDLRHELQNRGVHVGQISVQMGLDWQTPQQQHRHEPRRHAQVTVRNERREPGVSVIPKSHLRPGGIDMIA